MDLELSGGVSQSCVVGVGVHMPVDDAQRLAEFGGCGWRVGGDQRSQQSVVDLGVEDRHALAVGGELVGVGVRETLDEAVGLFRRARS